MVEHLDTATMDAAANFLFHAAFRGMELVAAFYLLAHYAISHYRELKGDKRELKREERRDVRRNRKSATDES